MANSEIKPTVALLGGSFNPVHNGHIGLARWIAGNTGVSGVWLSLSPSSPFKQGFNFLPDNLRLNMLRIAVEPYPELHVTDIELTLPHPSFTIDALNALASSNPSLDFRLVIGTDNIKAFNRWKDWEKIVSDYGLIIYPRPGYHAALPQFLEPFATNITILSGTPSFDISSTMIREKLAKGEPLEALMPQQAERLLRQYLSSPHSK